MNKIKRLFLKLLQNKIIYEDNIVPVVIKDYWYDVTPCITIRGLSRDRGDYLTHRITVKKPLDISHPLYNNEKPNKKYPHLAESTRKSYEIQINVWCNTEKDSEVIVEEVKNQLFLARNGHYTYCAKYDSETHYCKTINEPCKAINGYGYKGLRGLCPSPREYHCCSLFNAYNVIKNTIIISPDYESDEYDHKPPLKRSIIDIELDYYDIMLFPSNPYLCYETPQLEVKNSEDKINELIGKYSENG